MDNYIDENCGSKSSPDDGFKPLGDYKKKDTEEPGKESGNPSEEGKRVNKEKDTNANNTNNINTVSPTVNVAGIEDNVADDNIVSGCADDPNMPELEEISRFSDAKDDDSGVDMNNLDTYFQVSPIPTARIHKHHPLEQIIGDLNLAPQTRRMTMNLEEHSLFSSVQQRTNHKDFQNCLFGCFLSQVEPKKMDERGIVIRNKVRLVVQGYTQEEGIYYDEMDVKIAFLYHKIEEEVYVCQPLGFEDLDFPDRVYKLEEALYGLHQAPRAWYETLSTYLLDNRFQRGKIDKTLFIKRDKGDILFTDVKTTNTPMETHKPLLKDENGKDVDEHMYRSMIGSLMYLTSSRPDIMFAVCAYARYQVNPKVSHLHDVKSIFRYLKGQPKLGLWYLKDSPFDLVAYTNSDYVGANLDRKSTTGGCQFLGCRLISWQYKKQTVVANSITKAKYVAASSCCGQVL
ncbi:putative ribonuclease H-like domain-containing protein [Tanacetum coccineum]